MIFPTPLECGKFIKRYKRFMVDIERVDGTIMTAHCPNSGALQGVSEVGQPVWFSRSPNPDRKLPYTWEMAQVGETFVGVNTMHPNGLVEEAIQTGVIAEFQGYTHLKREVPYGKNSRVDILLDGHIYIEVKNVHLKRGQTAAFPSSVTARGAKHMEELAAMVQQGFQAYVIYVVQRNDCDDFEIAADIDPAYDVALKRAMEVGLKALVYECEVNPQGIHITRRIPLSPSAIRNARICFAN